MTPFSQRNASTPAVPTLTPTTTEPSADTSEGLLKNLLPPGRSPRPMNVASSADAGDVVPSATNAESARTLSKGNVPVRFMADLRD
jgi:hypothetical protein